MASKQSIRSRRFELQGMSALTKREAAVVIDAVRSVLNADGLNRGLPGWKATDVEKLQNAYDKLINSWNFTYEVDY